MKHSILGIDPGSKGALAFYDGDELIVYDMPVMEIRKGKSIRKRFDPHGMMDILRDPINICKHAFVEQVSAQPGNGAAQAFTYGWMVGGIDSCLAADCIPVSYVTPMKWKKSLQCPREKDGARLRASQLMPQFAHNWQLKKHDGRAEAALIAYYGFHQKNI